MTRAGKTEMSRSRLRPCGDLAPGDGAFEDLPEPDAAPAEEVLADDLAELGVTGQRGDQAEHQLGVEADVGAVGASRHGLKVAAQ